MLTPHHLNGMEERIKKKINLIGWNKSHLLRQRREIRVMIIIYIYMNCMNYNLMKLYCPPQITTLCSMYFSIASSRISSITFQTWTYCLSLIAHEKYICFKSSFPEKKKQKPHNWHIKKDTFALAKLLRPSVKDWEKWIKGLIGLKSFFNVSLTECCRDK